MNVSIETMSGLRATFDYRSCQVKILKRQITTRFRASPRVRLKFLASDPGKVPLKEVRRRYGALGSRRSGRRVNAVEHLSKLYSKKESLNPAGSPNLEVVKMDPGIDFEFTATFRGIPFGGAWLTLQLNWP